MKKILSLLLLLFVVLQSRAGICNVAGQEKNAKEANLRLYLLYAGAHYHNQYIDIPLFEDGKFSQAIDLPYPVFALLRYNGIERRLLLSPGRDLSILFDATAPPEAMLMAGDAAIENRLLFQLRIGDPPFFIKDGASEQYAKMPLDSLHKNLLPNLKRAHSDADNSILNADIPPGLQHILQKEWQFATQCYLYDLAGNNMRWTKNKDQEIFLDEVMNLEQLPDSATLTTCLFANMSLEYYARYQLIKASKDFRTDSAAATMRIQRLLGIPFAEITRQVAQYGERYILQWLYAKNNLPKTVQDKLLFNRIIESADNKLLTTGQMLEDTLRYYFPGSYYLPMATAELDKLRKLQHEQAHNSSIVVHDKTKLASLRDLPKAYPGKAIYVDIWGTWCGPCREEMAYVAEVKARYSGKEIVFVYIDMDDDDKDSLWKEMLHLYALEGEHYRLNNADIQALWKEIGEEGGETNRYPTYVLFGKDGKVVKANAKRPGDGEALYEELDKVLN